MYQKVLNSGLFSEVSTNEFRAPYSCDICRALAGASHKVAGYVSLEEAGDRGNLYEFWVCPECLIKTLYGED